MNMSFIPNFFTGSNLALGVMSITLSATGEYVWAAWCVIFFFAGRRL